MKAEQVRAGFVQSDPAFGDVPGNLGGMARHIHGAPPFDVIVIPELFASGYLFRDRTELESLAEPADGATVAAMREWAADRGGWICGGFPERDGERVFNSAALVGPDGSVRVYRKVHLFDRETLVFDPGDRPFEAWDIRTASGEVRIGVMVCFDWFFPESARSLALDGAELILHPSNLVKPYCQDAMVTRCLENGVFAVTANRTGCDDRGDMALTFTGRSQITAPRARVPVRAGDSGESVVVERIDLSAARDKHVTERNKLLRDRRPEAYRRTPR